MNEIILPENIWVGIYDSRLEAGGRDMTENRITSAFEIELPIEQGGTSYIDSGSFRITPDTVICVKPGQVRHTRLPFKCYFIHMEISGGKLREVLEDTPDAFVTNAADKYRKIFGDMFEYYNSTAAADNIILQSLILKLIYAVREDCTQLKFRKKAGRRNAELTGRAIEFINANLENPITLDDIARYVSLSPIHFHNTFKAATGVTPHRYLNELRIKKAAKLLVTTDMKLTQIAYECGFSSQAYFNYAFKKYMSVTPREYMRKIFERYPYSESENN